MNTAIHIGEARQSIRKLHRCLEDFQRINWRPNHLRRNHSGLAGKINGGLSDKTSDCHRAIPAIDSARLVS